MLTRPVHMVFGVDEPFEGALETTCREFADRTRDYWLEWVRRLAFSIDWQDEIIRAAITLKLCSFEETGAIVAALTTSIPEGPKSGRNWDYRFCWMRDAFFVVRALNRIGATQDDGGFHLLYPDHRRRPRRARCARSTASCIRIRWRSTPRRRSPATTATGRCASATPPARRTSTTSMAASSWRRRRCSSTAGCRGRATRRCSG